LWVTGLSEPGFYRKNRALLAALLGIAIFIATAAAFTGTASNPVVGTRFNITSSPNSNLRFWIVTWETYYARLWIGQPSNLDRKTFDLITGCNDYSIVPPLHVDGPKWIIKSVRDQNVVVEREAILVNPPPNECSSTTGGHVFSLGGFALAPGRYQFELKFRSDIPESMNFPVELSIHCCGKNAPAHTGLGSFPLFFAFVLFPLFACIFAVLGLLLLIRAGVFLYRLQFPSSGR